MYMKRRIHRFICFLIVLAFSGSAWGMSLCDYRSPESTISNVGMSFLYRYCNGSAEQDINRGQLRLNYNRLFNSPNFGYELSTHNNMTISALNLYSFSAMATGNLQYYFSPEAAYFGFAGTEIESSSDPKYKAIGLFVSLGIGYGRFTDVTPMVRAMQIESYLIGAECISGPLHEIDLQSIAYEIDNINTYESLADILDVLQGIIEGTRLIRIGGLGPLDLYEMARIIEKGRRTRYCGGNIKLGLGYEIIDPYQASNDILGTAAFNYAFASTPKSQLLVQGSASSSYDILNAYQLRLGFGYDYDFTDMITLSASYSFSRQVRDGDLINTHDLSLDLAITPSVPGMSITLEVGLTQDPNWVTDVTLFMSMDFL